MIGPYSVSTCPKGPCNAFCFWLYFLRMFYWKMAMQKLKKTIACFITLALIWTSMPWHAFAQVHSTKPGGMHGRSMGDLSHAGQIDFASHILSFATQLSHLP